MNSNDLKKLQNMSKKIKKLNSKIKLISLLEKAKVEYDKNCYEDCFKTCNEVLKTSPENAIALRGLGCIMQNSGNIEKALEYYLEALNFSTNKEIEYTLIGTIYYNQENLDEAIKYYNLAIEENDNYDLAYEGRNQSILENHLKIIDLQDALIKQELDSY